MFFASADCHNDVVKIVELACKHNVCLIPYGGEYFKIFVNSIVQFILIISAFLKIFPICNN